MPPTGAPVKTPTYEDELLLLEAARLIAGTYEGNPRNYEDVWYLFWLQFFKIWTLHIFCLCMPSAQYSVYTKWAADVHNIIEQVDFSNLTSASDWTEHIGSDIPNAGPDPDWEGGVPATTGSDIPNAGPDPDWEGGAPTIPMNANGNVQQPPPHSEKAEGKKPEPQVDEPQASATGSATSSTSTAQQTEPGRDTTQRIPDTCLVAFHIPKLTPETARAALAERLKARHVDDDQPLGAPSSSASQHTLFVPPANATIRIQLNYWQDRSNSKAPKDLSRDPIANAMPAYREVGLHKGITQFKPTISEHKGGATRGDLPLPDYVSKQLEIFRGAQRDCANQGRLYLMHCQDYSTQTEVLLIATVDDTWVHTIMRRVDDGSNKFKVQMDPWSRPVIVGSPNSDARETKLLAWINERFPHNLGPLVRENVPRRREPTPTSDAGGDRENDDGGRKSSEEGKTTKRANTRRGSVRLKSGHEDATNGGPSAGDAPPVPRYDLRSHAKTARSQEGPPPPAAAKKSSGPRYNLRGRSDKAQQLDGPPPRAVDTPPNKRRRIAADSSPSTSRKSAKAAGGTSRTTRGSRKKVS